MKTSMIRGTLFALALMTLSCSPLLATCGGGGGGGVGGMGGGMGPGSDPQVYQVPWRVLKPTDPPVTSGLVL